MLLPDYDEEVFVPWAAHGLDATSLHRLRIPSGDLEEALGSSEAGLIWFGDDAATFAPYFSRREASMLEHLLVFPFVSDSRIVAVLLITETAYFEGHVDHLRIVLAAVGEPAAHTIGTQRATRFQLIRQSIVFKPSEIGVVTHRIASRSPRDVMVLLVQLPDLVSQIAQSNDHLDVFRVWQDILRAIAALFASTASVCDADEHRALVLIHGPSDDDTELVVRHIAATLARLFPEVSAVPELRYQTRRYPDNGTDLSALVTSML